MPDVTTKENRDSLPSDSRGDADPVPSSATTPVRFLGPTSCLGHRLQLYASQRRVAIPASFEETAETCKAGRATDVIETRAKKKLPHVAITSMQSSVIPLYYQFNKRRCFLSLRRGVSVTPPTPTSTNDDDQITAVALAKQQPSNLVDDLVALGTASGRVAIYANGSPAVARATAARYATPVLGQSSWTLFCEVTLPAVAPSSDDSKTSTNPHTLTSPISALSLFPISPHSSLPHSLLLLVGTSWGSVILFGVSPGGQPDVLVTLTSPLPSSHVTSCALIGWCSPFAVMALGGWMLTQEVCQLRFTIQPDAKSTCHRRRLWVPDPQLGHLVDVDVAEVPGEPTPRTLGLLGCAKGVILLQLLPELVLIDRRLCDSVTVAGTGVQDRKQLKSPTIYTLNIQVVPVTRVNVLLCISSGLELVTLSLDDGKWFTTTVPICVANPMAEVASTSLLTLMPLRPVLLVYEAPRDPRLGRSYVVQTQLNAVESRGPDVVLNEFVTFDDNTLMLGAFWLTPRRALLIQSNGRCHQLDLISGSDLVQAWITRMRAFDYCDATLPDLTDTLLILLERPTPGGGSPSPKVKLGLTLSEAALETLLSILGSALSSPDAASLSSLIRLLSHINRHYRDVSPWTTTSQDSLVLRQTHSNTALPTRLSSGLKSEEFCRRLKQAVLSVLFAMAVRLLTEYFQCATDQTLGDNNCWIEGVPGLRNRVVTTLKNTLFVTSDWKYESDAILMQVTQAVHYSALTYLATCFAMEVIVPEPSIPVDYEAFCRVLSVVLALSDINKADVSTDTVVAGKFSEALECVIDAHPSLLLNLLRHIVWDIKRLTVQTEVNREFQPLLTTQHLADILCAHLPKLLKRDVTLASQVFSDFIISSLAKNAATPMSRRALFDEVFEAVKGTATELAVIRKAVEHPQLCSPKLMKRFVALAAVSRPEKNIPSQLESCSTVENDALYTHMTHQDRTCLEFWRAWLKQGHATTKLATAFFDALIGVSVITVGDLDVAVSGVTQRPATVSLAIPNVLRFPGCVLTLYAAMHRALEGVKLLENAVVSTFRQFVVLSCQSVTSLSSHQTAMPLLLLRQVATVFRVPLVCLVLFPRHCYTIPRSESFALWKRLLVGMFTQTQPVSLESIQIQELNGTFLNELWEFMGGLLLEHCHHDPFQVVHVFLGLLAEYNSIARSAADASYFIQHAAVAQRLLVRAATRVSLFSDLVDVAGRGVDNAMVSYITAMLERLRGGQSFGPEWSDATCTSLSRTLGDSRTYSGSSSFLELPHDNSNYGQNVANRKLVATPSSSTKKVCRTTTTASLDAWDCAPLQEKSSDSESITLVSVGQGPQILQS